MQRLYIFIHTAIEERPINDRNNFFGKDAIHCLSTDDLFIAFSF
ncbi:MAG: hypothetical protein RMX96_11880 [Nostoc sp. ChiSLP02]|nr:hypothetical protein [Nostoc sp. DedSLP05]MDZ8103481.1 hypothetical protein [Nostoc sp. DedSLP01]MDZ8185539.1 hypothetical protein [Nostoc sp. ChiSLP02]